MGFWSLLSILGLSFLISCAPRDGAQPTAPRVRLFDLGAKLPTCSDEGAPTWSTIRLYAESSFLFENLGELRNIVAKGSRTCVEVNRDRPIEIEYEVSPGQFRRSGHFYYVRELQLMDTRDLLADDFLMERFSDGMGITPEELRAFLLSSPRRDQVHVMVLGRAGSGSVGSSDGPEVVEEAGQKLSTCSGASDPTWSSIRLFNDFQPVFEHISQFRQIVTKGSRNCVPVGGSPVEVWIQEQPGASDFSATGVRFHVDRLERMGTRALLQDTARLQELAQAMGWTVSGLSDFLNGDPWMSEVTIAHVRNSSLESEVDEPHPAPNPPSSFKVLRYPNDQGKTLSQCQRPWTDIRLSNQLQPEILAQVESQQARVFIGRGETNCLVIGEVVSFSRPSPSGGFSVDDGLTVKVTATLSRRVSDIINDSHLSHYIAQDMGVTEAQMYEHLEQLGSDLINLTYFEWQM
jgi:hypothetical protein